MLGVLLSKAIADTSRIDVRDRAIVLEIEGERKVLSIGQPLADAPKTRTSEDSVQITGIPFLSRIPIIGQFFSRTQRNRNQSQIFITLQGNIIDDK